MDICAHRTCLAHRMDCIRWHARYRGGRSSRSRSRLLRLALLATAFFAAFAAAAFCFFASARAACQIKHKTHQHPSMSPSKKKYTRKKQKTHLLRLLSGRLLRLRLLLFFLLLRLRLLRRRPGRAGTALRLPSLLLFLLDALDTRVQAEREVDEAARTRAISSFFLRARSVLFFFSVYRLSSRLSKKGKP